MTVNLWLNNHWIVNHLNFVQNLKMIIIIIIIIINNNNNINKHVVQYKTSLFSPSAQNVQFFSFNLQNSNN